MSFNYNQEEIEEILCTMYNEVCELRELNKKSILYRDHYCEGAVSELLEKGIFQANEEELCRLLDDYSVFSSDYKACDYLTHDMKINPSNWPTDFDDVKTNFKNEMNQALNNKFKTKIIRSTMINSIAISLSHYQQTITIGVILTQKAIAVKIVYEANDGFYIQCEMLKDTAKLYGVEIICNNNTCLAGPEIIENDKKNRNIYNVMIGFDFLSHYQCDNIDSINFIITESSSSMKYGDRSAVFDPNFVQDNCAYVH